MTQDELNEIVRKHGMWIRNEDVGVIANLSGSDLSDSNLRGSDLRGSDLRGSNLSGSDLRGSNLSGAKRFCKTLKHFARWDNLYNYGVEIAVSTDKTVIVKMGCKELTLQEWESNWFNNYIEFPDDGSAKTKHRIAAYNFAVNYARIEGWIDATGKAV